MSGNSRSRTHPSGNAVSSTSSALTDERQPGKGVGFGLNAGITLHASIIVVTKIVIKNFLFMGIDFVVTYMDYLCY